MPPRTAPAFETKSEWAYRRLREMIADGTLAAGSRLVLRQLATDFGLSEMPVREALRMLQRDGLVAFESHRGATVIAISGEEVLEGISVRMWLEVLAVDAVGLVLAADDAEVQRRELAAPLIGPDEGNAQHGHSNSRHGCDQHFTSSQHLAPPHGPNGLSLRRRAGAPFVQSARDHGARQGGWQVADRARALLALRGELLAARPPLAEPRATKGRIMRDSVCTVAAFAAITLASTPVALAQKPAGVPPSGSTCGAFYGSVISDVAHSGALSGQVNPGVLHSGFAGAEDFPGFDCP
jgi:hypothetical protein